jgi:hypothetical protein
MMLNRVSDLHSILGSNCCRSLYVTIPSIEIMVYFNVVLIFLLYTSQ